MKSIGRSAFVRIVATIGFAACVAAFLRGEYLLGFGAGVVYASITYALFWLLVRSRTKTGKVSITRVILVAVFATVVEFALTFPATINPDVDHFIELHATGRDGRREFATVLASDPAFSDLSVSTTINKGVVLTLDGTLVTKSDLDRLRTKIESECPTVHTKCDIIWEIRFRDTGERINGVDRELFKKDSR